MVDRAKRARAVWTLANAACGGKLGGGFGYGRTGAAGKKPGNKRAAFSAGCAVRLRRVRIECRAALCAIGSRGVPDAFFRIGPPYAGADRGRCGGCAWEDFDALLKLLERIRGGFLLSPCRNKTLKKFAGRSGGHTAELGMALSVVRGQAIRRILFQNPETRDGNPGRQTFRSGGRASGVCVS
jgi:hypothetical protein